MRKSVFTIGSYSLISRITGFIRDMMIAAAMGAGVLTDIFFVAFKLPNFFRRLFGEGAFNAAFVPMFSAKLSSQGKEKAKLFAENIFAVMFFFLLALIAVFEIFMPLFMLVFAPGFASQPENFDLAVYLTRITFPYLFFICMVAMMSGVLNSLHKFAIAASAPIFLNISLISALIFFADKTETPAHALAWGVIAAGIIQFAWLYFACRRAGLPLSLKIPKMDPEVKKMIKLMIPGIIGAGIVQINLWIDTIIGTFIPKAISYLYYADRINQFPLGVIGVAVGTALLPLLSKQVEKGDKKEAIKSMNKALGLAMFLVIPCAVGALVVAEPVVAALYQRGAFDYEATRATAYALMAYAIGLPAFVMIKVFTPGFFSVHDTTSPLKIAVMSVVINILLCLILVFFFKAIGFYPHVGIALATGIAAWINVFQLVRILKMDGRFVPDYELNTKIMKIIGASLAMGAVAFITWRYLQQAFFSSEHERIVSLCIILALSAITFFVITIKTKAVSIAELKNLRRKKK